MNPRWNRFHRVAPEVLGKRRKNPIRNRNSTMTTAMSGIYNYLNLLDDIQLQQYAQAAGVNAFGGRQVVLQQLAQALVNQGYGVALAGQNKRAVGVNTALVNRGSLRSPIVSNGSLRSPIASNGSYLTQPVPRSPGALRSVQSVRPVQSIRPLGSIGSVRSAPSFSAGQQRSLSRRSGVLRSDQRSRIGGNNPSGFNQYNGATLPRVASPLRSNNASRAGAYTVQPIRTQPLTPSRYAPSNNGFPLPRSPRSTSQALTLSNNPVSPRALSPRAYSASVRPLSPRALSPRAYSASASVRPISPRALSPRAYSPPRFTPAPMMSARAVSPRPISPRALSPRALSPRALSPRALSPRAVLPVVPGMTASRALSPRVASPRPLSPRTMNMYNPTNSYNTLSNRMM
jgi:hypothetical protein